MAIALGLSLDEPIKNRGSRERGKEKDLNYDILSSLCEGYTGSDLLQLCKAATYFPIRVSASEHKFQFNEDEARRYFQQLINAIDYCHSRGVYHRNLKPENFLLDAYGNLKLSDFGPSAPSQQVRDDGLNYVASEVLNDRGNDGTTVDVWSCGVILFILIAGYLPFDDSNLMNLYKKVLAAEFNCPPWLSFNAMESIIRILEPNPITRITILKILEEATEEVKISKVAFEEALNRVEAANREKLAVEEALRKWIPDHGQRRRSVHNSTKFKNSCPSLHRRESHLLHLNGLNLASDGSAPVLKPTLSIGQILSMKLLMQEEFESGMLAQRSSVKRKVSLGEMLSKQYSDQPSFRKAQREESGRKQLSAKRKQSGFARFSLLLAKQSKKKKRPTPDLR